MFAYLTFSSHPPPIIPAEPLLSEFEPQLWGPGGGVMTRALTSPCVVIISLSHTQLSDHYLKLPVWTLNWRLARDIFICGGLNLI